MAQQFVTRVSDQLAAAIDALVADGLFDSRSDAVRVGLADLIERRRRAAIGEAISAGYRRTPQTLRESAWTDATSAAMIAEEPW